TSVKHASRDYFMHFVFYTTLLSQVGIYRRKNHSLQRLELGEKTFSVHPVHSNAVLFTKYLSTKD
ncbi:MAG: hypothetical protein ACK56F_00390, partial [bacterium]